MEILYVLLGSIIALIGGFLSQKYQMYLSQIALENEILLEINDLLLIYSGKVDRIEKDAPAKTVFITDIVQLNEELIKKAIRLRTRKNLFIGIELTKIAFDEKYRTSEKIYDILKNVQLSINRKLVTTINKGINDHK